MKKLLIFLIFYLGFTEVFAEEKKFSVAILLFSGVELIDFVGPMEVFSAAGYKVFTVSETKGSVSAWPNLKLEADYSFQDAPVFDVLLTPGGNTTKPRQSQKTIAWVEKSALEVEAIISVCTGSEILGDAGLLDDRDMTTFFYSLDYHEKTYPKANVLRNSRYVDSGKIITSAGLSSGIDAALYFVAKKDGLAKARSVATWLEYGWNYNDGYIRGDMADTVLPDFSKGAAFNWKDELSYGDKNSWHKRLVITSTKNLLDIRKHFYEILENDPVWNKLPELDHWKNFQDDRPLGQAWSLKVVVSDARSHGQYMVDLYLELQ